MKKLVALVLTFLLVLTGCSEVKVTKVKDDIKTDGIKFSEEYKTVDKDNLYEYATYTNVIDTLNNKTGVIYLGFSSCELCKKIVPVLNEAANEKKLKSIMYYDFKDIRQNNTTEYQELVDILSNYVSEDDSGEKRITAPTILFVKNGNIVSAYIGKISSNQEEIITEEELNNLKNEFLNNIEKMYIEQTTTAELQ